MQNSLKEFGVSSFKVCLIATIFLAYFSSSLAATASAPNLFQWTSRASGTDNYLLGATYGNGVFVTVGSGSSTNPNPILTSTNGQNWSVQPFATNNAPATLFGA